MPEPDRACFQAFLNALPRKFAKQDILSVLGSPTIAPEISRFPVIDRCSCRPILRSRTQENHSVEIREKLFKN
jgi:hypothetical protein